MWILVITTVIVFNGQNITSTFKSGIYATLEECEKNRLHGSINAGTEIFSTIESQCEKVVNIQGD